MNVSKQDSNGMMHNEIPTTQEGIKSQIDGLQDIKRTSTNPMMKKVYNGRMEVLIKQKNSIR